MDCETRTPRLTVLIIDDQGELRDALAAHLDADGLAVAVAANGQDARVYLRAGLPVCAIVVNLAAPGGWTLLAQRHGDPVWRNREMFVISGPADEDLELLVEAIRAAQHHVAPLSAA